MDDPRRDRGPVTRGAGPADLLRAGLQVPLPQHLLSRLVFHLTRSRSRWLSALLIRTVVRLYRVDLDEALEPDPAAYPTFNDFFTRPLRPGARPLAGGEDTVVSPVDGVVSQAGSIDGGRIFQAKGHHFTVEELLGGDPAPGGALPRRRLRHPVPVAARLPPGPHAARRPPARDRPRPRPPVLGRRPHHPRGAAAVRPQRAGGGVVRLQRRARWRWCSSER